MYRLSKTERLKTDDKYQHMEIADLDSLFVLTLT